MGLRETFEECVCVFECMTFVWWLMRTVLLMVSDDDLFWIMAEAKKNEFDAEWGIEKGKEREKGKGPPYKSEIIDKMLLQRWHKTKK